MKQINQFFRRLCGAFVDVMCKSIIEMAISMFMMVCGILIHSGLIVMPGYMALFPIFFTAAFVSNRLCRSRSLRWVYWLTAALPIVFAAIDVSKWIFSPGYVVALILCFLLLFAHRWTLDNTAYVKAFLKLLKDVSFSLLIAGVVYSLLLAISHFVVYIFSLPVGSIPGINAYAAILVFLLIWPMVFLLFQENGREVSGRQRFLELFVNYVFTPALMVYMFILYVYFVYVLVSGCVPKGGIALCVFLFVLIAASAKAVLPLLRQVWGKWYYRNFSFLFLPALVMFALAVYVRVSEYGFTSSRVYLIVCGLIMTLYVLLFMKENTGRYLYMGVAAMLLLSTFTFIPGISAAELGIFSQTRRVERMMVKMGLEAPDGKINASARLKAEAVSQADCDQLYAAYLYLWREMGEQALRARFGVESPSALKTGIFPETFVAQGEAPAAEIVTLSLEAPVDIRPHSYVLFDPPVSLNDGICAIKDMNGKVLLEEPLDRLLARMSDQAGFSASDALSTAGLRERSARMLVLDYDSMRIFFRNVEIRTSPAHIVGLEVAAVAF